MKVSTCSKAWSLRDPTQDNRRFWCQKGLRRRTVSACMAIIDPLLVAQEVARQPTEIRLRWRSTGCMGVTIGSQLRRSGCGPVRR
jgi:hypothetical protein